MSDTTPEEPTTAELADACRKRLQEEDLQILAFSDGGNRMIPTWKADDEELAEIERAHRAYLNGETRSYEDLIGERYTPRALMRSLRQGLETIFGRKKRKG